MKNPKTLNLNVIEIFEAERQAPITLSSIVLYLYANSGQAEIVRQIDLDIGNECGLTIMLIWVFKRTGQLKCK